MADDPQHDSEAMDVEDTPTLRFLRRLVTILTATMILGVLTIVVLLVIRLNEIPVQLAVPAQIMLPEGTRVVAVTQTATNILVVTETQNLLIYNASGTELLGAVQLGQFTEGSN